LENLSITIIGLGLIGGSYALALRKLNPKNIWAVDIDETALNKAEKIGMIDKGYLDASTPLQKSDLVIICLYPNAIKNFIQANSENFKKGAIITDVAGVKNHLIEEVNGLLPVDVDFVFGHPMAGKEKKGLEFSSADIFKGANYIITPNPRNKEENIKLIEETAQGMGFKNVSLISPEKHDDVISFTSQLTHVIAVALVNSDHNVEETNKFIGDSYRDLTRIAKINSELWSELFMTNKKNLIDKIEKFEAKIDDIKKFILENDYDALIAEFNESSSRREKID
jgi:prephenate dehydrogenase